MSIQVQCPNADCGQVHKVKNKYAGLTCRCPACGEAMHVPGATVSVGATAPALSAPAAPPTMPEPAAERPVTIDFSLPEKTPRSKDADDEVADLLAAAMEETEKESSALEAEAADGVVIEEEVVVAADEDGMVVAEEEVVAAADDEVLLGGEEAVEAAEVEEPAIEAVEEEAVVAEEEPIAAVEEDAGIVVADEEEAVVAEEEAVVADDDFDDLDAPPKGKKAPAKGKGKPAGEDEEEAIVAEDFDDLNDLDAPPKGKKPPAKGKGKPAPADEDEEAIIAEDDLADLAPPPKKKAKGKAAFDEDEDEEGITSARPKQRRDDEDEDEDNVRPLRGRRGDDEDEDEMEEEDEEGDKKKGKFAMSTAVALLVGVIGLFVLCAFPFLGSSSIKASGGLANSPGMAEILKKANDAIGNGISENGKMIVVAACAVGAVASAVGLFLAWRKRTVGVVTMLTSYLGWLTAWLGLVVAVIGYGGNLESLANLKRHIPSGPGGELSLSIGTSLWVGWVGSALAVGAFALAILDMHKKTWAKVVFLVLFLLLGGLVFLAWSNAREKGGQAAVRQDAVAVVRQVTP